MLRTAAFAFLVCASSALGLVHAVDSSQPASTASFSKAKGEGFTKAVLRGYELACSEGGRVDPNFVPSYNNARAAGITNIDMYWQPCTGSQNACKSFTTQIAEIRSTIKANSVQVGRIWVDIERDSGCNNWNYGTSGNLSKAKEIVEAMKASGFNFGIYSSPGEWSSIFDSAGVVLDSSAPLWYATWDNVETLSLSKPFGGWTSAVGRQYSDRSASGPFSLSVFAN